MSTEQRADEQGVFTFCVNLPGCECPKLHFTKEEVIFTDDFGGRCRFSLAEWNLLVEQVKQGSLAQVNINP